MSLAVAARYARALLDIVAEPGSTTSPDQAVQALRAFQALQDESVELRNILQSPAVPARRKHAAASRFGEMLGFSPILRNFLFVLIDHRRTSLLGDIVSSLQAQLDERRGIVRASVSSARPLDDAQRAEVEAALARLTGKQVFGQYAVDGSLIGGLVARVGSRVYDGSVRGQLQALRGRLVQS